MGKYTGEAHIFRIKTNQIISSLQFLTEKLNSIIGDLEKNDDDVISINVLSRLDEIESKKKAIINNLEIIASQVMNKAIILDRDEEKKKNTMSIGGNSNNNVNMIE